MLFVGIVYVILCGLRFFGVISEAAEIYSELAPLGEDGPVADGEVSDYRTATTIARAPQMGQSRNSSWKPWTAAVIIRGGWSERISTCPSLMWHP